MNTEMYCKTLFKEFAIGDPSMSPWEIVESIESIIYELLDTLPDEYDISGGIAIHSSAVVDPSTLIKAPAIIGPDCFVGPHGVLRGGVILAQESTIGAGCEVKQSVICRGSALAHFNYVGNSIIGHDVNLEAGAVIANHYNEHEHKTIQLLIDNKMVNTGKEKFGAVVGDGSKIGANAVLSPGTILQPKTVVRRLELIEQIA
jgi:UDP-N-acetylglucosamine diphosphorylase / glucose-1-phosphate thymidylyltransferase / UDP-N-acetylgalactosamine diphosphorylase / glucosamine-1-phosphate N-acetyltransferase / galactosamine-1-phosphate N-acetyltransferase